MNAMNSSSLWMVSMTRDPISYEQLRVEDEINDS